jgi:hypothetical protein
MEKEDKRDLQDGDRIFLKQRKLSLSLSLSLSLCVCGLMKSLFWNEARD